MQKLATIKKTDSRNSKTVIIKSGVSEAEAKVAINNVFATGSLQQEVISARQVSPFCVEFVKEDFNGDKYVETFESVFNNFN